MSFIDGIIDVAKNVGKSSVRLSWEPLPSDDVLRQLTLNSRLEATSISIPNRDLAEIDNWNDYIDKKVKNRQQKELLIRAFASLQQDKDSNLDRKNITPRDYFALLRDRNLMNQIFNSSGGVRFSLDLLGVPNSLQFLEAETLSVTVYEFPINKNSSYYRFTVSAESDRIDLVVPKEYLSSDDASIQVEASAGLKPKNDEELIGPLLNARTVLFPTKIAFDLEPERKAELDTDNSSLFLGPSIRASAFSLAVGAALFDEDNSLEVNEAILLSIDLSRLLNIRQEEKPIRLQGDSVIGGDWYKASSLMAQNWTFIDTTMSNLGEGDKISFRRVCDASGMELTEEQQSIVVINRFKRGQLPALPIYLANEDRIIGLIFLLTIALRCFTPHPSAPQMKYVGNCY